MTRGNTRLLVLDGEDAKPGGFDEVLLWKGFRERPGMSSVARHLEQHGPRLRAKYLSFVHELGQRTHRGRRLIDHFQTRSGYSVWWMNRVAEKSPFKSPRIYDCLRLLALEEIIVARQAASLTLRSADDRLVEAIAGLCGQLGIAFSRDTLASAREARRPARRIYEALPHSLQGLISFRQLWMRRGFRALREPSWFGGAGAIGFITYFFTLDRAAADAGHFRTQQWGALPQALAHDGRRSNWVHHYLPDSGVPPGTAIEWLDRFNTNAAREGRHAFLETFLTLRVLLAIAGQWLWLHVIALRMRGVGALFQTPGSKACFWPLLRDDFRNSLLGTAAVSNAAWLQLFDAALQTLPKQQRGFYLYEGQGWETAMLHAWRRHGHGPIHGVPHSSMPFWYLNIYDDPRVFEPAADKPIPDGLCVNGPMAHDGLIGAGYPSERLVPVESLRYQYLRDLQAQPRPARAAGPLRLLVLGDFSPRQTLKMLQLVHDAARLTDPPHVAVKLHPSCLIETAALPRIPLEFVEQPLGDIARDYDVAFCSNSTSAAIDALLAGLRVAIFLDDDDVNQSPLRGHALASFVADPAALVQVLNERTPPPPPPASEFFWIDEALPRWRALLGAPVHA